MSLCAFSQTAALQFLFLLPFGHLFTLVAIPKPINLESKWLLKILLHVDPHSSFHSLSANRCFFLLKSFFITAFLAKLSLLMGAGRKGFIMEAVVSYSMTGCNCCVYRKQGVNVSQGPHPGGTTTLKLVLSCESDLNRLAKWWSKTKLGQVWKKSPRALKAISVPSLTFSCRTSGPLDIVSESQRSPDWNKLFDEYSSTVYDGWITRCSNSGEATFTVITLSHLTDLPPAIGSNS